MKARLPQGYGGGGGGNMQSMIRQAQKMQEDMATLQAELAERAYTASSGGGAVTATVNGQHAITELIIKPEVIDPEDADMLADLITAAVNSAMKEATDASESEMGKLTGGMNLPGLF